jgi:hypothetical protein
VAIPGFRVTGLEPDDTEYRADPRARRWFWREAAVVVARVKRDSLVKGLGKSGDPLAPIHPKTRQSRLRDINPVTGEAPYSPMGRARPNAPPLMATGRRSRTYTLLKATPRGESVWVRWEVDPNTGLNWGIVLARHAAGFSQRFRDGWGHVPSRDVVGLSRADWATAKSLMALRWAEWKRTGGRPLVTLAEPGIRRESGMVVATDFRTGESRIERGNRLFYFTEGVDTTFRNLPPTTPPAPLPPTPPRPPALPAVLPVPTFRDVPYGIAWDAPLPDYIFQAMPEELRASDTFRRLIRTRAGLAWWREVGRALWEQRRRAG